MQHWIYMVTFTLLTFCELSHQEIENPSNANLSKSSDDDSSSDESTGLNSDTNVQRFLRTVPVAYQHLFIQEGNKVAFQPGSPRCMPALKWLEETYNDNIWMINTLIRYNMASCDGMSSVRSYCGRNALGHTRSFRTKCHQCARGCKDVLRGGPRYVSHNRNACKEAKKECSALSCENNGTCVHSKTEYVCLCPSGFQGTSCVEDTDECNDENKCSENANCENTYGSYTCTCHDGYSGDGVTCIDIDECASFPCQNGATCVNYVNGYECNCAAGFHGTNCDEDIDECASSPCQNGATCINYINGYECNCTAGFDGTNCDEDIDECNNENTCSDNANCDNTNGSYTCTCQDGYVGDGVTCIAETFIVKKAQQIVQCMRPSRGTTEHRCNGCYSSWQHTNRRIPTLPEFDRKNCIRHQSSHPVLLSGDSS